MGNARLNLQKVGTTLNIQARDDADTNLDFTISAQGTGKIRLGSILAVNDLNFQIPNSIDETKVARFSTTNLTPGITNVFTFPDQAEVPNNTDELLTLKSAQTMENKTIVSPVFSGALTMESFTSSGNATIGDAAADSLTVNAAATFAASTTFSNSVILNQGATVTGNLSLSSTTTVDMATERSIRWRSGDPLVLDLQMYYSAIQDASFITSKHQFGIYAEESVTLASFSGNKYFFGDSTNTILYHDNAARITTSATGINIGGAIDAVTSITGSGDIAIATDKFTLDSATGDAVFGGNITGGGNITATSGTNFEFGSVNGGATNVGVGRTASTYNLEVEGTIYATGSTITAGNGSAGKFILQKGAAGIGLHFTDNTGTDQAVLDSGGNFGLGKSPSYKFDVSGNSNIDGDLAITTTNPAAGTGGKITAREIILTDPITSTTSTLNAQTSGGVSRARVYFQSFN